MRSAQPRDRRRHPDTLVLSLQLLPEHFNAPRLPTQVSGRGDREHRDPPPRSSGLKTRNTRIRRSRRSNHHGVVLEHWAVLLVGLVEPRNLPLLVRERSWILAAAPSRCSAELMADVALYLVDMFRGDLNIGLICSGAPWTQHPNVVNCWARHLGRSDNYSAENWPELLTGILADAGQPRNPLTTVM